MIPKPRMDFFKAAPSTPPWHTYKSQLSKVVEGEPLWTPGPYKEVDGSVNPIKLTDVGYDMQGRFVKLFNAAELSPSPSTACDVFPYDKLRDPIFNARTVDRFTTSSVEACITNVSADKNSGNVQISADLSSRYGPGAAMILPGTDGTVKMESYDLRHQPFYSDYCFKHCESWLQTAAHTAAKHVELKDLIFVTGIDMVHSWALFAFPSSSDGCSVEITAGPTSMFATRQDSKTSTPLNCPPVMNFGPVDRQTPGSLDQCVVIRRFKIHRRIEKLKWQMSRGLRKVMLKRAAVAGAMTIDGDLEDAEAEHAEDDSEASDDEGKKGQTSKQRRTKSSHETSMDSEGSDLPSDRRGGGGAGGAGSSGKNGNSSTGLPPGNGGGRRDPGSGGSGSDGSNGQRSHVSTYTLRDDGVEDSPPTSESDDYFDSDSDVESVDSERLEPIDALLEYILEACPSARYAGAGDHDLIPFQSMLSDWESFPTRLRTMKPHVHLQSNGLALLKDSVYYTTSSQRPGSANTSEMCPIYPALIMSPYARAAQTDQFRHANIGDPLPIRIASCGVLLHPNDVAPDIHNRSPGTSQFPYPQFGTPSKYRPLEQDLEGTRPIKCNISPGVDRFGMNLAQVVSDSRRLVFRRSHWAEITALRNHKHDYREKALKAISPEVVIGLKHPNIAPFNGVSVDHEYVDRQSLMSPRMDNSNVTDYLARKPYCDRFKLMSDVASGLEYLHSSGVVHGDLRGANIVISDNLTACIADFGRARLRDAQESTLGAAIRWKTPEILDLESLGDGETTLSRQQSEFFSFCLMVYEVFIGKTPYSTGLPDSLILSVAGRPGIDLDAPELLLHPSEDQMVPVSYKSDMWVFTMVVIEILTGGRLWSEYPVLVLPLKVPMGEKPDRRRYPAVSDSYWRVLTLCWEFDPSRRPSIQTFNGWLPAP